ncbi:hypothetical protein ACWDTP_20920 [Mycobacterium sp. NPDC003449]
MLKKTVLGFVAAAALSLPLAGVAGAEDEEKPNPLSAEGLCGCNIPTLSVGGLLGHEEWAEDGNHPLSAEGFPKFLKSISPTFGDGRNGIPTDKAGGTG